MIFQAPLPGLPNFKDFINPEWIKGILSQPAEIWIFIGITAILCIYVALKALEASGVLSKGRSGGI